MPRKAAFAPWMDQAAFDNLPVKERALLIAAHYCDKLKVKEQGHNRGQYVEMFQQSAGAGPGTPYCASFVTHCLKLARLSNMMIPKGPAAVRNWAAYKFYTTVKNPERGDLFYWLNPNLTGHIGFVVKKFGPVIWTIEANTDADGSREGDGVYRKKRYAGPGSKLRFIQVLP